jgi:hypothetical protein
MIRCESPQALKHTLKEVCYEIEISDQRAAKALLASQPGVLSVEPYGAKLHLFLAPGQFPDALQAMLSQPSTFRVIVPSLEDVFIGLIRKSQNDSQHGA